MLPSRRVIVGSIGLGLVSLLAMGLSHLALVDIAHGEPDTRLEWIVLRVSALILFTFVITALHMLGRLLRAAP